MSILFSGIVHVSGEHDTGKTMFAFSCGAQPEDIAFIDDDVKGRNTVDQIKDQGRKLGYYKDLVTLGAGKKEVEFHKLCMDTIEEMRKEVAKRGKPFDAVIWDTWTRFENTFHPFVSTFPGQFRQYWSPNGAIKGAEQWKEAFRYESETLNKLQEVAKLVIITTHLKPETVAGKKTGKFIPDCKQPVVQKSLMRVYLRHNPDSPAPIGLVLKRISKQKITEEGIEIVAVLPRKLNPFTWKNIRHYWDMPVDNRKLDTSELPDEWELSILDGTLTADQKKIWDAQETPDYDTPIEPDYPVEVTDRIKAIKEEGKPLPLIMKMVNEEFGTALTIPDITKVLAG